MHVLPIIATALRSLNLSAADLDRLLVQMRAEGFRHATRVKTRELRKLIQGV